MGGHGDTGGAAVFALDYLSEAVEGQFASTDVEQRACHRAYHIAEEAVAADGEDPFVAHSVPMGLGEVADVGLHLGVELGKAGEIVIFHQ